MEEIPKILVVDDKSSNLISIEALLLGTEANLVFASSGNEALEKIFGTDFALILLDVQMPDMDGFEVAEVIRGREKSKHIPIIFITAINQDQENVFKGYEKGAVDFLFKPLDPIVLIGKVNIFLELFKRRTLLNSLIKEKDIYINELKQLNKKIRNQQKQLLKNERERSILEIALGITHEINQPLSVIIGYIDILISKQKKDTLEYTEMKKIRDNAERISELTNKLQNLKDFESVEYLDGKNMIAVRK